MGQIPSPANPGAGAVAQLAAAVTTIEANYTGAGGAEATVGAGLVQAETDITAIEANYTGAGGAEATVGAGLVQAETDITALQGVKNVVVSKAFGSAEVAALGAVASGSIDFDADLPAGAVVIGAGVNVTAVFDNAGDSASCAIALGVKSGDTDGFMVAGNADTVCKLGTAGVLLGGLVGAIRPSILVDPDVNCNTITKGAAVAYLIYTLAF